MITNLSWLKEVYNERIPCLDEAVIAAKLNKMLCGSTPTEWCDGAARCHKPLMPAGLKVYREKFCSSDGPIRVEQHSKA